MLRPHRYAALVLALVAVFGCKRKTEARPLTGDDGRDKKKDCELVAGGVIAQDALVQAGCLVTVGEKYVITKGATLTIEPGAKVSFNKGASLEVQDGAVIAKGSTTEPIVFTSAEAAPAPGDWGGIVFAAKEKSSTLDHVIVEWAGPAAVRLTADAAKLALVGSTIRHAARIGLTAEAAEPFDQFANNAFDSNGGFAMDVPAAAMGSVKSMTSAEPVRVHGSVAKSQTWPQFSGGFVVASLMVASFDPAQSAVLTLAPQTIVRVEPKVAIAIGDYLHAGTIVATRARFTSSAEKPARGDWAGIRFGRRAPGTAIADCVIEFAGYEPPSASKAKPKKPTAPPALAIVEAMKDFKVVNTTFRDNAGPGMGLDNSFGSLFGGTGGCEGLDAPKNGNKSIGQPLCEYHEDPFANVLGVLGEGSGTLGTKGLFDNKIGDSFGAGGLGMKGTGLGGGGASGGGIADIGAGGGTGSGKIGGLKTSQPQPTASTKP
jgi:hypothetical protein